MRLTGNKRPEKRDYRIQTLITQHHRKKLQKLAKKYGRMNDVIEMGIDLVEKFENAETCDNCELNAIIDLFNTLGNMSDYVYINNTINEKFVDSLLRGISLEGLFLQIKEIVQKDMEFKDAMKKRFSPKNLPYNAAIFVKELSEFFKMFNIIFIDENKGKLILQPRYFKNYPELEAFYLLSILDIYEITFDLRIKNNNIILDWIDAEKDASVIEARDERLMASVSTIQERLGYFGKISKFIKDIQKTTLREEDGGHEGLKRLLYLNEALELHNWQPGTFVRKNKRLVVLHQEIVSRILEFPVDCISPEKYQQFLVEQGKRLFLPSSKCNDLDEFLLNITDDFRDVYGLGVLQKVQSGNRVELLLSLPAFPCQTIEYLLKGGLTHQNLSLYHGEQCITKGDYQCVFRVTRREISICIIDDDEAVVRSLKRILELDEKLDYRIFTARDVSSVMKIVQNDPIDIFLVDYHLGEMNGVDLLKQMYVAKPNAIRILFTGIKDINIAADAINKAKVQSVLTKPLTKEKLLSCIRNTVSQSYSVL
ncbi:MAG: response regulator [Candidatus Hodarchaeales archaeon]